MLIPLSGIGQTDSTQNYRDFSRSQLLIQELQQLAKILPQAESYYHQNKSKDSVIAGQRIVIDTLTYAINTAQEREKIYLEQIALKDKEIKTIEPKWWQQSYVIISEVIISLIIGVIIAK